MVDFKEERETEYAQPFLCTCDGTGSKTLISERKVLVGPVVKEGFYYDIDLGDTAVNDDVIERSKKR